VSYETHTEQVIGVINSLIESESTWKNYIPIRILKLCKNILSLFLEQTFNLCVKEGTYPQSLKCAERCIHEHGRPQKFSRGEQRRHFADHLRLDFRKTLYPFFITKKTPHVTETITKCASLAETALHITMIYTVGHLPNFNAGHLSSSMHCRDI